MALERVSMLEDQLAASSQEVKSNVNEFLYLEILQLVHCEERTLICIVCLPILSPSLQVISLKDQIKRRQQGVDGGKDVREGFMHVGSSCFCVCVSVQRVVEK